MSIKCMCSTLGGSHCTFGYCAQAGCREDEVKIQKNKIIGIYVHSSYEEQNISHNEVNFKYAYFTYNQSPFKHYFGS